MGADVDLSVLKEVENRVDNQLTWRMVGDVPTSFSPDGIYARPVLWVAFPAYCVNRRVVLEEKYGIAYGPNFSQGYQFELDFEAIAIGNVPKVNCAI